MGSVYQTTFDKVNVCIAENTPMESESYRVPAAPPPISTTCEFRANLLKYTRQLNQINDDVNAELKMIAASMKAGEEPEPYTPINPYLDDVFTEELERIGESEKRLEEKTGVTRVTREEGIMESVKKYGIYIAIGLAAIFLIWKKGVI